MCCDFFEYFKSKEALLFIQDQTVEELLKYFK